MSIHDDMHEYVPRSYTIRTHGDTMSAPWRNNVVPPPNFVEMSPIMFKGIYTIQLELGVLGGMLGLHLYSTYCIKLQN